jgi:hypothetical protein
MGVKIGCARVVGTVRREGFQATSSHTASSARLEAVSEACTAATRSLEAAEDSNYCRSNSDSPYILCCTVQYI